MTVLGISAFFHDSAACLIKDGNIVAAITEERLSRKKHDSRFPSEAVKTCLDAGRLRIQDVDLVIYYEKPFIKFERVIETYVLAAPFGLIPFAKSIKDWITKKLWIPNIIAEELEYRGKIQYAKHHECHAAASCFTSGFERGAYLVMDAVGEKATTSYGTFNAKRLNPLMEQVFPHSIGMLYSSFTQYCGFKVNSGEYKLMGLAPYGKPEYVRLIKDQIVTVYEDGSIELNMSYFSFDKGLRMINQNFQKLFGRPTRNPSEGIEPFHQNIASSIQKVVEEIIIKTARHVKSETGESNLCIGGGVALNCVANSSLRQQKLFDKIFIQPSSGDDGASLGAAILGYLNSSSLTDRVVFTSPYLGVEFTQEMIREQLDAAELKYELLDYSVMISSISQYLAEDMIIGWFQGKDEWGPRALGNRSILASPRSSEMKGKLNQRIKKREGFRPFAPVVLEEHAFEYFEIDEAHPFMQYTVKAKKFNEIPACSHIDKSSRLQTVNKVQNHRLHDLLQSFYGRTSIPVLINTSFNERGEPIVHSPRDAINTFLNTHLDILAIGNFIVRKNENLGKVTDFEHELD